MSVAEVAVIDSAGPVVTRAVGSQLIVIEPLTRLIPSVAVPESGGRKLEPPPSPPPPPPKEPAAVPSPLPPTPGPPVGSPPLPAVVWVPAPPPRPGVPSMTEDGVVPGAPEFPPRPLGTIGFGAPLASPAAPDPPPPPATISQPATLGAVDVEGRLEDTGRDNPAVHVEAEGHGRGLGGRDDPERDHRDAQPRDRRAMIDYRPRVQPPSHAE